MAAKKVGKKKGGKKRLKNKDFKLKGSHKIGLGIAFVIVTILGTIRALSGQSDDGSSLDNSKTLNCAFINWVGDGICDDKANIVECDFDEGDCCGNNNKQECTFCLCHEDGDRMMPHMTTTPKVIIKSTTTINTATTTIAATTVTVGCFEYHTNYQGENLANMPTWADDDYGCQSQCNLSSSCKWFVYFIEKHECFLKIKSGEYLTFEALYGYISGPPSC